MRWAEAGVLALAATLIAAAPGAWGDDFTVTRTDDPPPNGCAPGDCSLREAVVAANHSADSGSVIRVPAGTYALGIGSTGPDDAASGDLDTVKNIDIQPAGSGAVTVDANGNVTLDRAFEVKSGALTLRDINIVGGVGPAEDADGQSKGGGIRVSGGVLYLRGGSVEGNQATFGGGIDNKASAYLFRTEVSDNQEPAATFGGAIWTHAGAYTYAYDSKFFDNVAGNGGALSGPGNTVLFRSQLARNRSNQGSGGAVFAGSAPGSGLSGGHYEFYDTTINGNVDGGGPAGAIRARNGTVKLVSSTVTGNVGSDTGGISAKDDPPPGDTNPTSVTLENSIVAGNTDSDSSNGVHPDCDDFEPFTNPLFTTLGYNVIGDNSGCYLHPVTGDDIGTSVAPVDPKLSPGDAFNGGAFVRAFTFSLEPGSPAINRGDPGSACAPSGPTGGLDARGVPRKLGGACDSGAYELVDCRGVTVNRVGTFAQDSSATAELRPTDGADGFLGFGSADTLSGGRGSDGICGNKGGDTLSGNQGGDRLSGGLGPDTLKGGDGRDQLLGGPGRDTCIGGPGKDTAKGCEVKRGIP